MRRIFRKKNLSIIITAIIILIMVYTITAFADDDTIYDYSISDCCWDIADDGHIYADWEKSGSSTSYRVKLYRTGKEAGKYLTVREPGKDYTEEIVENGSGEYTFVVYPIKGGRGLAVESDTLTVDSAYYIYLKKLLRESEDKKSEEKKVRDDGTILKSSLHLIERPTDPGIVRQADLKFGDKVDVVSAEFDQPYENWIPGNKVLIRAVLAPRDGYHFSKETEFSCVRAAAVSKAMYDDNGNATVTIEYIPSVRLKAPENIYIDENNALRWDKCEYADKYQIRLYDGDSIMRIAKVTGGSMNIERWIEKGCTSIRITAMGLKGNKYKIRSSPAELNDVDRYCLEGWQYQSGRWYYYIDGEKAAPGWFEDEDGNKYYFDDRSRMKTGGMRIDGASYFFNDGSNPDYPLGALCERER